MMLISMNSQLFFSIVIDEQLHVPVLYKGCSYLTHVIV